MFELTCSANCATFNWRNISGNLPNIPVNAVVVNPLNPNQVYAGTDWGLFFTDNVSAANPVWTRFDNGIPNVMIWDLTIDRGFTTVVAWTRGRGAWAMPLPSVPISNEIFDDGFEPTTP